MESTNKNITSNATSLETIIKNLQALKVDDAPRVKMISILLSQHAIDNLAKRMYHHISRKNLPQPREPEVDNFAFRRFKMPVTAQNVGVLLVLARKSRQIARNPTGEYKPCCTHAIRKMEHLRGQARQMFRYLLYLEHDSALAATMTLRARAAAGYFVFARVLFGRLRADNVDVRAELQKAFGGQMPKVAQLLQLPSLNPAAPATAGASKEQPRERNGQAEAV